MIVVDTNTLAYLYFPTDATPKVEALLQRDDEWVAPQLWRSEFRNILALYLRKNLVDLATACQIQRQAEIVMAGGEYEMDSFAVLALVAQSGCSAYDCEFVVLAQTLGKPLVTADKKVLKAFPDIATTVDAFISRS